MKTWEIRMWRTVACIALFGVAIAAAQPNNEQRRDAGTALSGALNDPAQQTHVSMLTAFHPVQGQANTFALTSQDGSKSLVLRATNDAAGLWVVDNEKNEQIAIAAIQDAGVAVVSSYNDKWQAISKSEQFEDQQLQRHQQMLTIKLDKNRQDNSAFGTQNPSDQQQPRTRTQPRSQPNSGEIQK